MPRYNEDIQLGGYVPVAVTPKFKATGRLAEALKTIDTRHEQALQQLSAIDLALSQVELNEAEDAWKANYVANIKQQIDNAAMYGSYSTALPTAMKLAGQVLSDPALKARQRYQTHYKEFIDKINNNKNLDQDTKDWAIAQNPYNYQDRYDNKGRVIGGTDWTPNKTPVDTVPLNLILSTALQWAKADSGGGTTATAFVNSKGEIMSEELGNLDMSDIVDVAYQKNNQWTRLGKDKLMEAVNAAIESTPGAKASLDQEFTVAKWKYSQLSDDEKMGLQGSAVTDINGKPLDFNQFLAKKINPFINAAQYSSNVTKVDYGTGFKTAFELKQKAKAAQQEAIDAMYGKGTTFTGLGYNITYDSTDYLNQAEAEISDALDVMEKLMPNTSNTKAWQDAKSKGDYDAIIRIYERGAKTNDYLTKGKSGIALQNAAKVIIDNKEWINDTYSQATKEQIDALKFKNAWDSGKSLPAGNLSKRFYNTFDRLLNGKYQDVNTFKISFGDSDDVNEFLGQLDLDRNTANKAGITLGNEDGNTIVTFNKDNDNLPKFIQAFNNLSTHSFGNALRKGLWIFNKTKHNELTALDNNNNAIKTFRRGSEITADPTGTHDIGSLFDLTSLYNTASYESDNFKRTTGKLSQTEQLMLAPLAADEEAKEKYGEESAEYARVVKENHINVLQLASSGDYAQMSIMGYDEDTGGLKYLDTKERIKAKAGIGDAIGENIDKVIVRQATSGTKTGYNIVLPGKVNDKGKLIPGDGTTTYFVESGITDDALQRFKDDTKTRALKEYNRRRSVYGSYRGILGNTISNISNTNADINGTNRDNVTARNYIEADIIVQDLINAINNGATFTKEGFATIISKVTTLLEDNSPVTQQRILQTISDRITNGR